MPNVATALTTPEKVKAYANDTTGANDELIGILIPQITDLIEAFLGRKIVSAEYTEKLDGWWTEIMQLKHRPVIEVASLSLVGSLIDSNTYEVDEEAGFLVNVAGGVVTPWVRGVRNYTAVYTAGYVEIPGGIEWVATRIVARSLDTVIKDRVGITTKGLPSGGTTEFIQDTITDEERRILLPYGEL